MLPHLFFAPSVKVAVYLDQESNMNGAVKLKEVVTSLLDDCNASFAAQAHPVRATSVMDEFEVIRTLNASGEPEALDAQEQAYKNDEEYMGAVSRGHARMIDGELLVRRLDSAAVIRLNNAWMRAYISGSDRDQPAFAYAMEKEVLGPRRRAGKSCDLNCGKGSFGFNIVASRFSDNAMYEQSDPRI